MIMMWCTIGHIKGTVFTQWASWNSTIKSHITTPSFPIAPTTLHLDHNIMSSFQALCKTAPQSTGALHANFQISDWPTLTNWTLDMWWCNFYRLSLANPKFKHRNHLQINMTDLSICKLVHLTFKHFHKLITSLLQQLLSSSKYQACKRVSSGEKEAIL